MNFMQLSQILRDLLAVVESPQVQRLFGDAVADATGIPYMPPPASPAPPLASQNKNEALIGSPDYPAGFAIPLRSVRKAE